MKKKRFYVEIMQEKSEASGSLILAAVRMGKKIIRFVVDCGLYQEVKYKKQNANFLIDPQQVDFVILTHYHIDNSGRLPYFVKKGFKGKIYTSKVTERILDIHLRDTMKKLSYKWNQVNYDLEDISQTMRLISGCGYNKAIEINDNITIHLIPNCHCIGSVSVLVQIHCPGQEKDINLLFSGDYNNRNLFFEVPPLEEWVRELPINMIIESTVTSQKKEKVFEKNIKDALQEKKTIIVLINSMGSAQEVLYCISQMQKAYPELFENVPIYYDGEMSICCTDMYYKLINEGLLEFYEDKKDFLPKKIIRVMNDKHREKIASHIHDCKIIVTTSSTGSSGPAQVYIPAYIDKPNALIHFTENSVKGTLGYSLRGSNTTTIEFQDVLKVKKADVKFTQEFRR